MRIVATVTPLMGFVEAPTSPAMYAATMLKTKLNTTAKTVKTTEKPQAPVNRENCTKGDIGMALQQGIINVTCGVVCDESMLFVTNQDV